MNKVVKRFLQNDALEPFYLGVDQFCKDHLTEEPDEGDRVRSRKIIADPVGGYCSLEGWEVGIVDTPLFQRLRSIRQLGLTYLVYPTLGYCRFEHVIGVRARFDQVIATIQENMLLRPNATFNLPTTDQLVRMHLAILCHDIGHCIFSHVSESVLTSLPGNEQYPSGKYITGVFEEYVGRPVPIAEVLSIAILTSPDFIACLKRIGMPKAINNPSTLRIAHDSAHLILGLPIPHDPQSLFLAQLMNSGLDIDKLDYMLRESLLSGISLGISLHWLMKKFLISSLTGNNLPEGLRTRLRNMSPDQQYAVLTLERGGQFAFEEFCVARLTLHEKIYLHQKTRAAEAQIKTCFQKLAAEVPGYNEVHRWLYLKESMLEYTDAPLPCLPKPDIFTQGGARTAATFGFEKIRERRLLTRAYAFGWQNSIGDPLSRDDRELRVDELMQIAQTAPDRLESSIRSALVEVLSELKVEEISADKVDILIDPPRLSTIQQGQDTIYIEHPPQLSLRWTMPIDRIEDYYHRNRSVAYIFAEYDYLPYVLLAAERAAWELCKVVCVQDGLISTEVLARAADYRVELDQAGFYDNARALMPVSEFLSSVEAQIMITTVAEKLAAFESRTKNRVSPASITAYVAQFPTELQHAALTWLQHLLFIRPDDELRGILSTLVNTTLPSNCKNIGLCPLGATTDSANHISYSLRDVRDLLPSDVRIAQLPLAEALGMQLDAYVIYDDNVNSGLQALNIVSSWMDKPLPDKLGLKEEHVLELTDTLKTELHKKPVVFAFASAVEDATANVKKLLCDHLEFNPTLVHCVVAKELKHRSKVFSGPDSLFQHSLKVKLREFLTSLGRGILESEGKSEGAGLSRCMGANRAEAMVVFPYNVPTMTIAALWIKGYYEDREWIPLVERGRRTNPVSGELIGEDA